MKLQSTLEGMKCRTADLEKKLQEKEKESENLRKSLQQIEKSAEQTHFHTEGYDVLQQQIKELTEKLRKSKRN